MTAAPDSFGVSKPQLAFKQLGVHTQMWHEDDLVSSKPDPSPANQGQDVTELMIGVLNHICDLFSAVDVGESGVVSTSQCY